MKKGLFSINTEIPTGIGGNGAKIEIYTNKMAVIDGCVGVIQYSEEMVSLNCKNGTVVFLGSGFIISSYLDNGLVLEGKITSVEFNM